MNTILQRVNLRPGERDDFEAIQRVDLAAGSLFDPTGLIDEGPGGQLPIPLEALEAGLAEGLLTVACLDGAQIIGFSLCSYRLPDIYLDQISVDPAYGRQGVGDLLMRRVISQAEGRRHNSVILSTFRDVPWNGPYYARYGFAEIPRHKMKRWMLALEATQSLSMDIKLRCFMRREIKLNRRRFSFSALEKYMPDKQIAADPKS